MKTGARAGAHRTPRELWEVELDSPVRHDGPTKNVDRRPYCRDIFETMEGSGHS